MKEIPLRPKANQTLTCILNSQLCRIKVYQKSTGLFFDLYRNDEPIVTARICRDRVRLIHSDYHGFSGDIVFVDTIGRNDPEYTELGSRYLLAYMEPSEI